MLMNLLQESAKNLASQYCGGAMRTIALSMPSHDCPGSAAGGPRRGFVPQAPTVKICASAGAPAATLRPILLFAGAFAGVGLCFCTSLLAARCPARVAFAPALAPARGMFGRVLYAAAFFLF